MIINITKGKSFWKCRPKYCLDFTRTALIIEWLTHLPHVH